MTATAKKGGEAAEVMNEKAIRSERWEKEEGSTLNAFARFVAPVLSRPFCHPPSSRAERDERDGTHQLLQHKNSAQAKSDLSIMTYLISAPAASCHGLEQPDV